MCVFPRMASQCVSNMMKATKITERTLLGLLCCAFFSGLFGVSSQNCFQSGLNFYTDLQELFICSLRRFTQFCFNSNNKCF